MLTKGGEARRGGADVVLGRWGYSAVLHAPPWGGRYRGRGARPHGSGTIHREGCGLARPAAGTWHRGWSTAFLCVPSPEESLPRFCFVRPSRFTTDTEDGTIRNEEYEGADDPTRRIDTSLLIPATVRRPSTAVFTVFLLCILASMSVYIILFVYVVIRRLVSHA